MLTLAMPQSECGKEGFCLANVVGHDAEDNPCTTPFCMAMASSRVPYFMVGDGCKRLMLDDFQVVGDLGNGGLHTTPTFVALLPDGRPEQEHCPLCHNGFEGASYCATASVSINGPTWLFSSSGLPMRICLYACVS